jgi:uncharacterized protein
MTEGKLSAIRHNSMTDSDRATLTRLEMLVEDQKAEQAAMAGIVSRSNRNSTNFKATVVLTLDCNLACPYCFEEGFRDGSAMTDATANLLVAFVTKEKIAQGRDVEIRFYGGEPLMALPTLKRIARALQAEAAEHGTTFSCSMVSNGTLLDRKMVEELLEFGLTSVQLTLDGPKATHDPQRPFVSGSGSFDAILANIREVYELVTLKLGGNFTRENYREFPRMLDALLEAGIDPKKLYPIVFAPILPKSGRGSQHNAAGCCLSTREGWLIEAALFLREETLRRGFRVEKPAMGACMVEFDNDLVVNRDGSLFKCPGFMGWPELSVGTLESGVGDYSASHNLSLWQNSECLACPYLPLCFGGCRLLNFMNTGTMDRVECRREFYDATLGRMVIPAASPQ